MKDERNHIDHLFRAALDNHTEAPPPDVWAALEQRLPAEKQRRRWGWLWGTLILLALLGGTAVVYSVLKKESPKAGAGRALADGNQPTGPKTTPAPATENPIQTTDRSLTTPTTTTTQPGANTANNLTTLTAQPRVANNTPRRNRRGSSAVPQRNPRRAGQANNNQSTADPNPDATARNDRPGRTPNASNNGHGDDPANRVANNNSGSNRRNSNRTRRNRNAPGATAQGNNTAVTSNPASQPSVASNDVPGRRSNNRNNVRTNRNPRNGNSNRSNTVASDTPADPGTTPSAANANPTRNRTGRAGGDVARTGGNRRGAGNQDGNKRRNTSSRNDPANGIALASGDAGNAARKPKPTDGATAGVTRKPTRAANTNNRRKPEDGTDVPPSDPRRNPGNQEPANRNVASTQPDNAKGNPIANPATPADANPAPANPALQAGNQKTTGRFSDDDPRGSNGLRVSDYINKPAAGTTAGKDDEGDGGTDDSKTVASNSGGGGGGGGGGNDKPKARPAPRGRWEGGFKAGYEIGAGGDKINKSVIGPYVQYNFSDRVAVVFQPAYKAGQFKGGGKTTTETYINVLAPPDVNTTMFVVEDSLIGIDSFYNQTITQSYDSIIVSRKIDAQSFWEVELPLLFSYQLSKMFSFFAGPVFSFNRQFTQSTTQQNITVNHALALDSLQTPAPAESYNNVFTNGQPAYSTFKPASASEINTGMGIGYMAGVQARIGIISADLTLQQRVSGLPDKDQAPQVRSALSLPYIRLSVGVRLFGNGKKQPTDRDMMNEQPYQRAEE